MKKYDIVNALITRYGYRKYLEICTPITGHFFSRINRRPLQLCHRLMYRAANFEDGLEVTFRNDGDPIDRKPEAASYDIAFVDPFHTFDCSMRDLRLAFEIVRSGGAIVVHDCCPAEKEICGAAFRPGAWCGLTYCAYIEFVLCEQDLAYYTVDTDYGCGVIKKGDAHGPNQDTRRRLWELWSLKQAKGPDVFDFFTRHRRELVNLISVRGFRERENVPSPPLLQLAAWRERIAALLHA